MDFKSFIDLLTAKVAAVTGLFTATDLIAARLACFGDALNGS
jgi:hypothetical protein